MFRVCLSGRRHELFSWTNRLLHCVAGWPLVLVKYLHLLPGIIWGFVSQEQTWKVLGLVILAEVHRLKVKITVKNSVRTEVQEIIFSSEIIKPHLVTLLHLLGIEVGCGWREDWLLGLKFEICLEVDVFEALKCEWFFVVSEIVLKHLIKFIKV